MTIAKHYRIIFIPITFCPLRSDETGGSSAAVGICNNTHVSRSRFYPYEIMSSSSWPSPYVFRSESFGVNAVGFTRYTRPGFNVIGRAAQPSPPNTGIPRGAVDAFYVHTQVLTTTSRCRGPCRGHASLCPVHERFHDRGYRFRVCPKHGRCMYLYKLWCGCVTSYGYDKTFVSKCTKNERRKDTFWRHLGHATPCFRFISGNLKKRFMW